MKKSSTTVSPFTLDFQTFIAYLKNVRTITTITIDSRITKLALLAIG